tara:strand:- start:1005 stop:1580 length:576 start_codon:yes stop_codon:yes gene_type:complete
MIREIVLFGDPVLREKGARIDEVTDNIRALAEDMVETMEDAEGVGLAAQQVGLPLQLAVVDVSEATDAATFVKVNGEETELTKIMPLIFINPVIHGGPEQISDTEGCLSFPEIRAEIKRPGTIRATLSTLEGETLELETDGLFARAIQHETDHLNGILFIDRMSTAKRMSLKKSLKALKRESEANLRKRKS